MWMWAYVTIEHFFMNIIMDCALLESTSLLNSVLV